MEFPEEKEDAMSRAEQEIQPEGIVHRSLGHNACNGFICYRESQQKEFFPQKRGYSLGTGNQDFVFPPGWNVRDAVHSWGSSPGVISCLLRSIPSTSQQGADPCFNADCSFSSVKWVHPRFIFSIRLSSKTNPVSIRHLSITSSRHSKRSYSAKISPFSTLIVTCLTPLSLLSPDSHSALPPCFGPSLNLIWWCFMLSMALPSFSSENPCSNPPLPPFSGTEFNSVPRRDGGS